MKYTVVSAEVADQLLADFWLKAADRKAVADAFNRIESSLKMMPIERGKRIRAAGECSRFHRSQSLFASAKRTA